MPTSSRSSTPRPAIRTAAWSLRGSAGPGTGVDPRFHSANRGKRSVGLDVKQPEGRRLLSRLLSTADVFVTNLRADTVRRLRLDVDDVRADNPSLIYVRGTAFGPNGPDAGRGGYDAGAYWARSGMQQIFTRPGDEWPAGPRPAFGDVVGGLTIAGAIGTALFRRANTGEASVLDASLLASGMWQIQTDLINSVITPPEVRARMAGFGYDRFQMPNPLMSSYRTRDGRFVSLQMLSPERYWPDLCKAIGQPDMATDPRFATIDAPPRELARVRRVARRAVRRTRPRRVATDSRRVRGGVGAGPASARATRRRAGRGEPLHRRRRPGRRHHRADGRVPRPVRRAAESSRRAGPSTASTPRRCSSSWICRGTTSVSSSSAASSCSSISKGRQSVNLLGRALIGDTSCYGEIVDDRFHVTVGDLFEGYHRNGQSFPMDDITLGAPIDGVRFINVMGGFVEPGTTRTPERFPMWLPKATNYASGDGAEIQMPAVLTGPMVMESELAVVVGRPLRKASPAEAHDAIFGWSVFNDFTAPEFGAYQFWAVAKSIDGFTSWGPWIRRDLTEAARPRRTRDHGDRERHGGPVRQHEVLRVHAERDDQPREPAHQPVSRRRHRAGHPATAARGSGR